MTDNPKPEPEAQALDLQSEIAHLIAGNGDTDGYRESKAIMELLNTAGWVLPGVPPVQQVLADARQYSDELVLTKLVCRVFRVMILGGLVIAETPQAMTWMRTYIDGDDRRHGPLGKPMVWPDSLPTVVRLLRDWGFQPTPTPIPYVSLRPGGPATRSAPDPTGPDPAMVKPVPTRRELVMGSLLDEIAGAALIMAVDRMTAIRAMSAAFDRGATHVADGWIVGNADRTHWRAWDAGVSIWTENREEATRYARREDAEEVHREDDDAWAVVPYADQEGEG